MSPIASPIELKKAQSHLLKVDPVLGPIIQLAGLARFVPHTNYYEALVSSIISQHLSVKAAASIQQRFERLFGGTLPRPEAILDKKPDELRSAGLSNAKANYVRDLAQHVIDKKIDFSTLNTLSNEEIITELTDVKGIGEWTVHMFLMFCMGRLDVLPVGDLGIRNGVRALYGLEALPSPDDIKTTALKYSWHPYESVASWYVWHSLDNKPSV